MKLNIIYGDFSVCQVKDYSHINLNDPFVFISKTDQENSLVCLTEKKPPNTIISEDNWKAFRIEGTLDFSLIGILSKIANLLAQNEISIFAISTYNTDYIFVKEKNFQKAIHLLTLEGYQF